MVTELVYLIPPVLIGSSAYHFTGVVGASFVLPCNATHSVPWSSTRYTWYHVCEGRHGRQSERVVPLHDLDPDYVLLDDGTLVNESFFTAVL